MYEDSHLEAAYEDRYAIKDDDDYNLDYFDNEDFDDIADEER